MRNKRSCKTAHVNPPDRVPDLPDMLQPDGWNFCGSTLESDQRFHAKTRTNFALGIGIGIRFLNAPVMLSITAKKYAGSKLVLRWQILVCVCRFPSNRFSLTLRTHFRPESHSAPFHSFQRCELFAQCHNIFTHWFQESNFIMQIIPATLKCHTDDIITIQQSRPQICQNAVLEPHHLVHHAFSLQCVSAISPIACQRCASVTPAPFSWHAHVVLYTSYTWDAVTSVNLNISMVTYLRRHLVCTIDCLHEQEWWILMRWSCERRW